MPRKRRFVEKVEPWSDLGNGFHRALIASIERPAKNGPYQFMLENQSDGHRGRSHVLQLEPPIRPQGLFADLIRAAGRKLEIRAEVDLETLVGCSIAIQFEPGTEEIKVIKPIEETHNGTHAPSTAIAADSAATSPRPDRPEGR